MNSQTTHTSDSTSLIFLCGAMLMANLETLELMQYAVKVPKSAKHNKINTNPCEALRNRKASQNPAPSLQKINIQTQTGNVLHEVEFFDQNLHEPTPNGNHLENSIFIYIMNENRRIYFLQAKNSCAKFVKV